MVSCQLLKEIHHFQPNFNWTKKCISKILWMSVSRIECLFSLKWIRPQIPPRSPCADTAINYNKRINSIRFRIIHSLLRIDATVDPNSISKPTDPKWIANKFFRSSRQSKLFSSSFSIPLPLRYGMEPPCECNILSAISGNEPKRNHIDIKAMKMKPSPNSSSHLQLLSVHVDSFT